MKNCLLTSAFLFCFLQFLYAQQTSVYTIQDGGGAGFASRLIELDNNRLMLGTYSQFGWDSSYVKLIWLDHNLNVLNHKEYRLLDPLTSVFDFAKMSNGFMFCGNGYTSLSTNPFMFKTDSTGNAVRQYFTYNMPDWQEDVAMLVPDANNHYTAYTATSSVAGMFYRIDGNDADTILHSKRIIVNNGTYFRPFRALSLDGNLLHLVTGTITDSITPATHHALIMALDTQHVHWSRQIAFGYDDEQIGGVCILSNGKVGIVGTGAMALSMSDGFVAVVDTSGTVVWSKKLVINGGGVYPSAIVETSNHDLLVFGNTGNYQAVILKFNSSGTLLWKKTLTGMSGPTYFDDAMRAANGEIWAAAHQYFGSHVIVHLDNQGNSCALADDSTIDVQDMTTDVSNVYFSMSNASVTFNNYPWSQRDLPTTSTQLCTGTGIDNLSLHNSVTAYPVPTDGNLHIDAGNNEMIHYEIADVTGRVISSGAFVGNTDVLLSDYHQGVYMLSYKTKTGQGVIKLLR